MPEARQTDVVLDPSQCVHIIDATKGTVECHVGPCRLDLAEKDRPVMFDGVKFLRCRSIEEAVQAFPVANEGDYIVLMNPAKSTSQEHPSCGKVTGAAELTIGRSVVIPGPASFPLWPGQTAKVIKGHQLRSNKYLVARVINETDAKTNWTKMVAASAALPNSDEKHEHPNGNDDDGDGVNTAESASSDVVSADVVSTDDLIMGKEIVIKGTDVSFFIPPTGIAVIPDENGQYVRDAVTLETVEYCVLIDEDGNKRYVRGPAVVFPEPTEQFVTTEGNDGKTSRKFRAVELNEISGIHVKVIADYEDDDSKKYKEGDELFITGEKQRIYFPRPEHAIIKYGKSERHFAVAIPEGEARYVLDRISGVIGTLRGPKMALLDPRKEVFVRRVLDQKTVQLWFPGNTEAQKVNASLEEMQKQLNALLTEEKTSGSRAVRTSRSKGLEDFAHRAGSSALLGTMNFAGDVGEVAQSYAQSERAVDEFGGDEIKRSGNFTPPRTITLDTKYEGAVTIRTWTGFAVQVVSSTGKREVVVGPYPRILNYDEMLEIASLSTSESGEPKSFHDPLRTPYLRVKNNRVSDVILAQTSDLVDVRINVSYRVNFEGDKDKWFNVENYVGLLCERCRSILRGKIKRMSIREFMSDSVSIVRNALLGEKPVITNEDGSATTLGDRSGLRFDENDMHLYDIEVLDTSIGDCEIAKEIESAQHVIVTNEIGLDQDRQNLILTQARQEIQQKINEATTKTILAKLQNEARISSAEYMKKSAEVSSNIEAQKQQRDLTEKQECVRDLAAERALARKKAESEQAVEDLRKQKEIEADMLAHHTTAFKDRMLSIGPDLIAALQIHGDKILTAEMMKDLGVMAALTGESVDDVYKKLMKGSVLADVFSGNGDGGKGIAANALRRSGLKADIEK